MKKTLMAGLLVISLQGLCQTLPFNVTIPPAPGSNTVEATNSITLLPTYQTTTGATYIFRVVPKRYANSPANAQNDYNYIRAEEAYVELFNSTSMNNADVDQKNVTYQYFDGLGRPVQTIQVKGSPDLKDVVVPIQYDQYGRQAREYLPYILANDGRYQTSAISGQSGFYNPASLYNNKIKTDGAPYAQTVFEKSPLNRVSEKGAPGTVWQPNLVTPASGKTSKVSYLTNTDGTGAGQEKIKIWTLTSVTLNSKPEFLITQNGFYASNMLSVSVSKDEDNRQVRTYMDKHGKTILKKVQYVSSPATNNDNDWTLTYYIYDEFQMLRFVLQPKFIARNSVYDGLATQQLKKDMLDSLTFEYRYDEKGRMVYKRVPGAKQTELVYDKWDRLVLSQDGNQRVSGKWSFTNMMSITARS
jgi:YD repeat-containing protein